MMYILGSHSFYSLSLSELGDGFIAAISSSSFSSLRNLSLMSLFDEHLSRQNSQFHLVWVDFV